MEIVTRAEWGASPPKKTPFMIPLPTPKLWLHHTASPSGGATRIQAIQDFHMDERGWNDIAYSFLINHEGTIYEGRGAGVAGGHTAGQNTVSHAICLLGNFDQTQPTDKAIASTVALARHGFESGWWPQTFTGGHRDAPGANTSCPGGNLYSKLAAINQVLEEDDMPSPKDWTDADWSAFEAKVGPVVTGWTLGAQFGGQPGSPNRKSLAEHILDVKAAIGAIDLEGISEAELDERVLALAEMIHAQPEAFVAKLKAAL